MTSRAILALVLIVTGLLVTVFAQQRPAGPSPARNGSGASGPRAAYLQPGSDPATPQAAGQPAARQPRQASKQTPRGITVAGEVKNFVPVTDAMLRNPDRADWLMLRR